MGLVHRGRHRHDMEVRLPQRLRVAREAHAGRGELGRPDLALRSTPRRSSSTRAASTSKPMTRDRSPNATATGSPTYPSPMTEMARPCPISRPRRTPCTNPRSAGPRLRPACLAGSRSPSPDHRRPPACRGRRRAAGAGDSSSPSAQARLQHLDVALQRHALTVADIVDPVRRGAGGRVGRLPAPAPVRGRGPIDHPDDALDDVIDVGEVPVVPAVVEHVDGAACQDVAGEQEQRHVGPAPRPVDGEEPQPGRGEPVQVAVAVGHHFVGLLAGRVERQRVVDVVALGERQGPVGAVHGARGCIDEVGDTMATASFEDVDEAGEVGVDVGVRVLQRVPDAGLRGEVDDRFGPFAREDLRDRRAVRDVSAHVAEAWERPGPVEPRLLESDIVVRIEIVDAHDLVATLEQAQRERGADESGRPGEKNLHGSGRISWRIRCPAFSTFPMARIRTVSVCLTGRKICCFSKDWSCRKATGCQALST